MAITGVFAEGQPARTRPYKLPPNLLEHFKSKYADITDERLVASLQETPDGPLGQISLYGKFPPKADLRGLGREERARAVAWAFIVQESALFDITNLSEIREHSLKTDDDGNSNVYYVRHIGNLQLVGQYIRIAIDDDGAITHVHATLTPVPRELYSAVDRKTITRDEVAKIVERDLTRANQKAAPSIAEPALSATWRPPYVVWGAGGALAGKPEWAYAIDAFTGVIMSKTCTAMTSLPVAGETPCD